MELKPKEEIFVQSYLNHNAHGTQAYLATHPGIKEVSARVNASRLLAHISIRIRISEELERRGLGITTIIKLLKSILRKKTYKDSRGNISTYRPSSVTRLEVIDRLIQLHGLSGNQIYLTSEQINQIVQMVKDFKELDQKQQENNP